jgi:hypothetical protein
MLCPDSLFLKHFLANLFLRLHIPLFFISNLIPNLLDEVLYKSELPKPSKF